MAGLTLRVFPQDRMIVNGAAMQFFTSAEFKFTNKVRFVYGSQIMAPSKATNTARLLYVELQNAYAGEHSEQPAAVAKCKILIELYQEATTSNAAKSLLAYIWAGIQSCNFYSALLAARRLVRHEDSVLAHCAASL